jgi:signal transduction histidine kinase
MKALDDHIHDIRKPLNTISMQAELIKMLAQQHANEVNPDPAKLDASAQKIIQNAKLCSQLLQALFDDIQTNRFDKQEPKPPK